MTSSANPKPSRTDPQPYSSTRDVKGKCSSFWKLRQAAATGDWITPHAMQHCVAQWVAAGIDKGDE